MPACGLSGCFQFRKQLQENISCASVCTMSLKQWHDLHSGTVGMPYGSARQQGSKSATQLIFFRLRNTLSWSLSICLLFSRGTTKQECFVLLHHTQIPLWLGISPIPLFYQWEAVEKTKYVTNKWQKRSHLSLCQRSWVSKGSKENEKLEAVGY